MKKIRVLQVNKLYAPVVGGVERVVQQIAEGLRDRVDMKVLVCQKKGPSVVERINGVEVHRAAGHGILFSTPLSLDFLWKFGKLAREADIVHIHMPFPLADVAALLSRYRGKVILWWHSEIVRQKRLLFFYRPFMRWLLNRADRIVVATEGHLYQSPELCRRHKKCVVIPFGVEPRLFQESDRLLERHRPVRENVRILFVGRLVYYKGCEILLRAFSQTTGADLIFVGEGPLKDFLMEQAGTLGMADIVHFLGYLPDEALGEQLADCDFLVLPSIAKTEAFGLVQIEAMAYGKPIINTALPSGVPYVSIDGVTGLTVEPGDVDGLACALQKLIDDRPLRERLGRAAYRRAREVYSMNQMLDRLYAEYETLVRKG